MLIIVRKRVEDKGFVRTMEERMLWLCPQVADNPVRKP